MKYNLHDSWSDFFLQHNDEIVQIISKIDIENSTPKMSDIFNFTEIDKNKIKVVILGQDPYPQKNTATGRCFEAGTLKNWNEPFKQISLKNIIRLVYCSCIDKNQNPYNISFNCIREFINNGTIKIKRPDEIFKYWQNQGVLLLNTALSCEINNSFSHAALWKNFTNDLIKYINNNEKIIWFLWGTHAISYQTVINGKIYASNHPMMCSKKNENDFLKNKCFSETTEIINWI